MEHIEQMLSIDDNELGPKPVYLYFHGSPKKNLESIRQNGLKTRYGRATFTTNPKKNLHYGDIRHEEAEGNLDTGMMTIWANPDGVIKPSPEGQLTFDGEHKIISGYPNIYKAESYAYCPPEQPGHNNEAIYLSKEHFVGAIGFNKEYAQKIKKINLEVLNGTIDEVIVDHYINELVPLIQELALAELKVDPQQLAKSIVYGIIRQVLMDQIRRTELSFYQFDGWEIHNKGDHPMNLKKTPEEAMQTIEKISHFIEQDFVPTDVRDEFYQKFSNHLK